MNADITIRRFIINVPSEELESFDRLCFQIGMRIALGYTVFMLYRGCALVL